MKENESRNGAFLLPRIFPFTNSAKVGVSRRFAIYTKSLTQSVQLPSFSSIREGIDLLGQYRYIVLSDIDSLIKQSDEGQQLNGRIIFDSVSVIMESIKLLKDCKKSLLRYAELSGETAQNNNDNGALSDTEN